MSESHEELVRQWGLHRQRGRRHLPLPLWWALWALLLGAIGFAVWVAVQPHPWRPPRGRPAFAVCTSADGIAGWCARVAVPLDPSLPHGRTIALRVLVLPATERPAVGALFYLEGGPAVAATDSAARVNELLAAVGRDRDLVLVDERGTGGSSAPSCQGGGVLTRDAAAAVAYLRFCFAALGDDARLYTTSVAADDLDAVRRTLGYGPVDLYGVSYGATLAQVYLARHPRSVRSAVLDGGSLLGVRVFDASARDAERALDADLGRCAAVQDCARAFPRTRRELDELLARPPRRVTIEIGTFTIGPDDVAWTVNALSQSAEGAGTIPFVVHAAAHGNYLPLARDFADEVGRGLGPRSRLATYWEILCSEPWAAFDPAATARAGTGSYLAHAAAGRARFFRAACAGVPKGRVGREQRSPRASQAPVLILAGGADPLDPPAAVRGWRGAFPHGRLVVVPFAAHGTLEYPCVQGLVARFVAAGRAAGLDASCVRRMTPPAFVTG